MKKRILAVILSITIFLSFIPVGIASNNYVQNISAGWYSAKLSVETASYGIEILNISENSVTFYVQFVGTNYSPIYTTDEITASVNNDVASFDWSDSWGNKGNGTINFANSYIILSMKQTYTSTNNRATLEKDSIILYPSNKTIAPTAEDLINKLKNYTPDSIIKTYYDDFNNDGIYEMFAFAGKIKYDQYDREYIEGSLWFISDNNIKLLENGSYEGESIILKWDNCKHICVQPHTNWGGSTRVYQVKNDTALIVFSDNNSPVYRHGYFGLAVKAWDSSYYQGTWTGVSYKDYYYYWDSQSEKYYEYGGTLITIDQLLSFNGAQEIIDSIDGAITEILYRANGIININVKKGTEYNFYMSNYLIGYDDNSVWTIDDRHTDNSPDYRSPVYNGYYLYALNSDMAVYPKFVAPDNSTPNIEIFEVNKYRANYLLNNAIGSTMENTYFDISATPSYILYQLGIESGLYKAASGWELFTKTIDGADSPSKLLDYAFEEKDVYSAILFNLLESSTEYKVVEIFDNEVTKKTKELVKTVTSTMKNIYNYDIYSNYNISQMTDKEKNLIIKIVSDFYEEDHPNAVDISELTKDISSGIDYAKDIQSYCELVASYIQIRALSESMKQVLQEMYNSCPSSNSALKQALHDFIIVINSSDKAFAAEMVGAFATIAGKDTAQFFIDKYWGKVKEKFYASNPKVLVLLAAYKGGKYISNILFNTDEICEKYFQLESIVTVEGLMSNVYKKLKRDYLADDTEQRAEVYNSAIDIMFNMLNTDCDYADKYEASATKSIFGQLDKNNKKKVENLRNIIGTMQNEYFNEHESILTSWIYELEADNYSLYKEYEHLLDESYSRIKKRYNIECPVDVYVYNSSGNLEGSIIDNVPYCIDEKNITLVVDGDDKTVYFYDNDDYNIVYVGNDTGTMDIEITEYDDEQNEKRNVYFNGIALTDGLTYSSKEGSSVDTYNIVDERKNNILADYDTDSNDTKTYTAELTRGYFSNFALSKELHSGERSEITAYVPEGYEFDGWTSDLGDDIFEDSSNPTTTIYMPETNITIEANIVKSIEVQVESVKENSVDIKMNSAKDFDGEQTLILASYTDNDELIACATKKINLKKDGAYSFTLSINTKNARLIKIFIWNSLGTMIPLNDTTDYTLMSVETEPTNPTIKPISDNDIVASGICGDNLTWTFYGDGKLEITGTGEMTKWELRKDVPWNSYSTNVTSLSIGDGVRSISDYAFWHMTQIKSVNIPKGIQYIGYTFYNCTALESVFLPKSVESLDYYAFLNANNPNIYYEGSEEEWGEISIVSAGNDLLQVKNYPLWQNFINEHATIYYNSNH